MRLPLVKAETQTDFVAVLEKKMIRARALLNELSRILDAEYAAGMAYDAKSLKKLVLRKQNSVNRFEDLARAMGEQLEMMAGRDVTSAIPPTLGNLVKRIPGLTPGQKDVLFPLAREVEQGHMDLMQTARRNGIMFKTALARMSVASKYANQGNVRMP